MPENRGGYRPTAPQNNPANISATGGAGQSGTQAATYIPGLPFGQGEQTYNMQTSAKMVGNPVVTATPTTQPMVKVPVISLTEPTAYPDRSITYGMDQELAFPQILPDQPSDTIQVIKALYQQDPRNEDLRYLVESFPQVGQ